MVSSGGAKQKPERGCCSEEEIKGENASPRSAMLPKANRVRKTKEFQGIFAKQKGVWSDGLLLKIGGRAGDVSRLGIVVSKKVAKEATRRNRIRRLLREAARAELPSLPQGTDLVIMVLPGVQLRGTKEARQKLQQLFRKAARLEKTRVPSKP